MNNLKIRFFFLLLFIPWLGKAQNTCFQKVYTFNDTLGVISNVYVNLDTTYIIGASTGKFDRTSASVIKLDKFGIVTEKITFKDSLRDEALGFGASKIYKDINGLFWFLYTSRNESNSDSYPKVLKFNENSNSIFKFEIDTLAKQYFRCIDRSRLIVDEPNDRYYLAMKYNYLYDSDTTSNLPWDTGTFILCYTISTDSLVYIKRHNFSTTATNKPRRILHNYLPYSNGNHLLILREDYDNSNFDSQYCKVLFYTINPLDGSVLSIKTLQDTRWSEPGYGATLINNEKDLLLSYTDSDTLYTNTGAPQPYYAVRPAVARLDSNFNVVWKDTLRTYFSTTLDCGGCIEKFVVNDNDSSFVGAYKYNAIYNQDSAPLYYSPLRITKRIQNTGKVLWDRDYYYFNIDYYNDPVYNIHDAESTLDGGYIFVGDVENFDSLQANAPGQLGYVLKTNCLGFLDDPQAGFASQSNDSLGVQFTNTSLMGGSYQWRFGDSTALSTDEFTDAVFHQYATAGTYEVMLIAYGCNGANDTLRTTIVVPEYNAPEPPANPNITNYMALGPNPVKSGESIAVYVGLLPSANCTLSFYDEQGKLVLEHGISQSKSTNIIVLPFGAGMYQAVLRNGDQKLEVEKIVVY